MKSIIEKWRQLFSSRREIIKNLEDVRSLKDADRVVIYTLGNKPSTLKIMKKHILYEVTKNKEVKKTTDLYNEHLLSEENFQIIKEILPKGRLELNLQDIGSDSVERWQDLKISKREILSLCLNRRGNYYIAIDNPRKDTNEEVLLKIKNLKRFF